MVNELPVPVDVFVMDSSENVLKLVGTLELQATFNVPLEALYTKTGELFFAPRGYGGTKKMSWIFVIIGAEFYLFLV